VCTLQPARVRKTCQTELNRHVMCDALLTCFCGPVAVSSLAALPVHYVLAADGSEARTLHTQYLCADLQRDAMNREACHCATAASCLCEYSETRVDVYATDDQDVDLNGAVECSCLETIPCPEPGSDGSRLQPLTFHSSAIACLPGSFRVFDFHHPHSSVLHTPMCASSKRVGCTECADTTESHYVAARHDTLIVNCPTCLG